MPCAERHRVRVRAQPCVIGRAHVGEARAERGVVRPDERIVAEHVDVIGDQHQVARRPERVHPAAGIGDDEGVRTECAQHAHGEGHLLERVPLVAMEPTLHRHHAPATERPEQESPAVRLHRREREARDRAVLHLRLDRHRLRESAEPRAEDDRDLGHERAVRTHGRHRARDGGGSVQRFGRLRRRASGSRSARGRDVDRGRAMLFSRGHLGQVSLGVGLELREVGTTRALERGEFLP